MRTITTETNVYSFSELSEKAKEKVKQWYLEGQDPCIFEDMCIEYLADTYTDSNLKVEFSLAYCQGDGLNIYGDFGTQDILKICEKSLDKKEFARISHYIHYFMGSSTNIPCNKIRYSYFNVARNITFAEDLIWELGQNDYRNIDENLIEKVENLIVDALEHDAYILEKDGYSYFYEIEDADLAEICVCNEWEFTEDGGIF